MSTTEIGSQAPKTPAYRVFTIGFWGLGLLALYGTFYNGFVATPFGKRAAMMAAIGVAALTGLATIIGPFSPSNPRFPLLIGRADLMRFAPLRMVVFSAFAFGLALIAIGNGAMSLWTSFTGEPGKQIRPIVGWNDGHSKWSCPGFRVESVPWTTITICADRSDRREAIVGRNIELKGPTSSFGLVTHDWQLGPRPATVAGR